MPPGCSNTRIHVGVSEKRHKKPTIRENTCNEINRMAANSRIDDWSPIVDTFRTFAVCPPVEVRLVFHQIQALSAA